MQDRVAQADMATVRATSEAQEEWLGPGLREVSAGQVATVTTVPMVAPAARADQALEESTHWVDQGAPAGMQLATRRELAAWVDLAAKAQVVPAILAQAGTRIHKQ